jgi:hypothetical protein
MSKRQERNEGSGVGRGISTLSRALEAGRTCTK